MLPDSWKKNQILVIHLCALEDVALISSALKELRQKQPFATITLMVSPSLSQSASHLPGVEQVLVCENTDFTSLNAERELALIELLSRSSFDAAIIFTKPGESPYPLAYICYLAGIPIRLGQSQEFGGNVLSQIQS